MKKDINSRRQKIVISVLLILAEVFGLYALIKETTWGDSLSEGIREVRNNGVYTPARYAFDGDKETYWALESGSTEGYADRYYSEEKDIEGIRVELYLLQKSRLTVMWEKDGVLLPYENGLIEGPFEGVKEITFSEEVRKTKHVVFKVEGEDASECRINEIIINERPDGRKYGKIIPQSYSFNQKEYINIKPDRLWNGYVNETWYEPLWYIPWEIQQSEEGRSGIFPDFYGHPVKQGEIIWELDGLYEIETLKAYFGSEWRSIAFEFWDGENWISKTELGRNSSKGWFRKEITKPVETERIRITFPGGWESARYINQIEVWGEGIFANTERKVPFEKDDVKGIYRASISEAEKEGFEADILTEGYNAEGVSLKINEDEKKTKNASYTDGKRVIYSFNVNSDELREGTQFLEINTYGKKLENITIKNKERTGRIKLGSSYTDKNRERSFNAETELYEKEFILDRKYSLEKIRIYAQTQDNFRLENDGNWTGYINCRYDERGYYEADFGGLEKDRIKICSSGEFVLNEIELYGSPEEDHEVSIEIWSNQKNARDNSCLTGWTGNSATLVTADESIHPRQADNLFWMTVGECGKDYLKKSKHEIKGELNGKTRVKKYRTCKADNLELFKANLLITKPALTVELPHDRLLTQNESIEISGCVGNGEGIKVFINGNEADVEKDIYVQEINLEEGLNTITVQALDSSGRRNEKTVTVIRDSIEPQIQIIEPVQNQYINTGTVKFQIDGKEEDLWWQFNDEQWERGYGRYRFKDYTLEDGFYTYTVRAQDRAGNISERQSVDFCMDKTLPESFEIKLNVDGWTNNNTPQAQFETTDETSGMDYYEYRIDENIWQRCESPLQLETLKDGKRKLSVRATDKAGNIREESIIIYVDTSCPLGPENARPVPDENSIFMKWTGADDNSISDDVIVAEEGGRSYRIEREPEWNDGSVRYIGDAGYGNLFWEDKEVKQGKSYSYRMWSVDRAGNESEKTQWKSVIAGLASAEIEEAGSTYVEFEGLSITLPENTTAEDIIRIQINEVPQSLLTDADRPLRPLLGGIYSVTAVRRNSEGEEYVTNHADLLKEAVLEIGYSSSLIPEDYNETQMAVFYYDDLWGSWLQMRDCYIDTEKQVIICKTTHFTEFSVQATKRTILTEAEIRESAYRLDGNKSGKQEINISGEDGGVSLRFEELFFPGKNGLDLSIQRVYSTGKANEDAAEGEDIDIDGGSVWKIADGWRISMPYMVWNGSNMVIYGTDGVCTSIGQMTTSKENDPKNENKVLMESHEYNNLKIELIFEDKERKFLFFPMGTSKIFKKAVLHQSNGQKIYYGEDGKVTAIEDSTGTNSIQFSYIHPKALGDVEIKSKTDQILITDSYGRTIEFNIEDKLIHTIKSGELEISYTTENNKTVYEQYEKENCNPDYSKKRRELIRAVDAGGREWKYTYEAKKLVNGSIPISKEGIQGTKQASIRGISALTGAAGPGAGYTKINYNIADNISYTDEAESGMDKKNYIIFQSKITAGSKIIWKNEADYSANKNCERRTDIGIVFAEPLKKNIFVKQSIISDGKTTTVTEYDYKEKDRNRLSVAPEAVQKVAHYSSLAKETKDNIQVLTYAKEIKLYDGSIDNNKLIQKDTNEISEEFMKITRAESVKGANKKTDVYVYEDKTGNLTEETHKTISGSGNVSADKTVRTYKEINFMQLPQTVSNLSWFAKTEDAVDVKDHETASYEKYEYNEYGQVTKASKGPNKDNLNTYEYSYQKDDGLLKEIISPESHHTNYSYSYNDDTYTTTVTYSGVEGLESGKTSVSETYVYDKQTGNLTEQTDRDGYITQNSYDKLGRITQIRKYHESGKKGEREKFTETTAVYDDAALTTTVTDGLGAVTVNTFDGLGRLTKVVKSGKTTSVPATDAVSDKAITIKLEYDGYDRVTKMTEPSYLDPALDDEKFTGTKYNYDTQNRLLRKSDADNNILEYIYDDENGKVTQNIKKISNGAERIEEKKEVYKDYNGNVLEELSYFAAYGESEESAKTVSAIYDGKGRKLCLTEAADKENEYKETKYTYDYLGNVFEVTYADGLKETNTYNKDGKLVKNERKGAAETSSVEYKVNALGYVIQETSPVSDEKSVFVSRKYDGRGNVVSESVSYKGDTTDVRTTSSVYDWMGNVTSQTDGEGNTTTYEYDNEGNLTELTDPRQNVASYDAEFQMKMEYDSFGRLIKGWLPQNEKRNSYTTADVYLVYDAQGNCIYRSENEGVETDYVYTKAGLLKEQITDGYETSYEYNGAGKLTKTVNPDGTWKASTYDKAGHLLFETISGNTAAVQYSYDKNGNVKTVTDRNGNVTEYDYDVMNRVVEESVAGLLNKKTAYDGLGRVKSETDGEENSHTYEYDGLGRVVKETVNTDPETVLCYEYDARGNVIKFTDAAGTVFKRTYTKTDLLSEEKVYITEGGSEVLKETRTYIYDEGGALKSVTDESGAVYYNGADSEYQPDAYGNTRKEKWKKTGFEMSYDYDKLNRLIKVKTPDGKSEEYTYNKNSQVTALSGMIGGTLSYNKDTRLETVTLNGGLKKTLNYNEAGLVSGISYGSDKYASLKTGFEYFYDKNFNITERTHKDTQEKDSFSYDGLNRLVTSSLEGKFTNDTYEQFDLFRMNEIDRDIDGLASEQNATLNGQFFPAYKVTLDEKGKSFVYDFAEDKEIQKIELFKNNLEKKSRIRERDLHIYTKQNAEDGWTELTPDSWNYMVEQKNQSIQFNLKTSLKTRFIKIRTIWDDRDLDNNNVSDYVTFSNDSVQKMIRIWTLENERNEEYDYDRNSNRKSITENGKNRSYTYYKNDKNGNTARVMFDGKWWYTYDDNGNRTAKGYKQNPDNDKVVIDETRENWKYTWDYHNRLVKVQQFNAPDNAQNVCVEYTYDVNNHRIERISKTTSVAETTQYAYGRNGALTYQKKIIGNKITSRTFSYLNNQIIGFTDLDSDGTEYVRYTVTDIQGSVTEVYDDNVSLLWKSGYTAFGIKTGENIKLLDFEGLYTGCDYDAETSLTYHWNRWRSEDGNSWLTQDPIRDGINWYGYAGQNPISHSDINGLEDTISAWQYQKDMAARAKERGETGNGGDNSSSGSCGPTGPTATPNIGSELINGLNYSINGLTNLDFGADFGRDGVESLSEGKIIQGLLYLCYGTIEAGIDLAGAYIGASALGATISAIGTAVAEQSLTAGYVDFEFKFNSQLSAFGGKVYNVFNNIKNTLANTFCNVKDRFNYSITYYPGSLNQPLTKDVADTFSGGTYTEKVLKKNTTLYRVWSTEENKIGRYFTRTPQNGNMQSQMDLALNPDWGNSAIYVEKIVVPKGTTIYEGKAASQIINGGTGKLLGGGNQIYIKEIQEEWF